MTSEERLGASGVGDEVQDRQADEERVERVVLHASECCVQRDPLRFGELPDVVEDGQHDLVHAGVPEGHLRLDTGDADDPELGRDVNGVADQRGLPDAGGAHDQERAALPTLRVSEDRVDRGPLGGAADEGAPSHAPPVRDRAGAT